MSKSTFLKELAARTDGRTNPNCRKTSFLKSLIMIAKKNARDISNLFL